MACTYKIVNLINENCYYGGTVNLDNRWRQHRWKLRIGKHENPHLQHAWNRYGEDNFAVSLLKECDNLVLLEEEQKLLDLHVDKLDCYNIAKCAKSPALGRVVTESTKKKIGKANKIALSGRVLTKEHRNNIAEGLAGNAHSIKTIELMSKQKSGSKSYSAKLTNEEVLMIRKEVAAHTQRELALKYEIDPSAISRIVNRKSWKYI